MGRRPKAALEELGESRELQVKVGLRIRDARTRAGLSANELAQAMEVTHSFIYLVETGKQNMTLQTLQRVADALNTRISALLPADLTGGISASQLLDIANSLADLAAMLRTRMEQDRQRIEQDRQMLERLEKLLADMKLMCNKPAEMTGDG